MFVVVSFDFGGSSSVAVHAVTSEEGPALEVWTAIAGKARPTIPDEGAKLLVELWDFEDGFVSEVGAGLFWGRPHKGARMVRTNNSADS